MTLPEGMYPCMHSVHFGSATYSKHYLSSMSFNFILFTYQPLWIALTQCITLIMATKNVTRETFLCPLWLREWWKYWISFYFIVFVQLVLSYYVTGLTISWANIWSTKGMGCVRKRAYSFMSLTKRFNSQFSTWKGPHFDSQNLPVPLSL